MAIDSWSQVRVYGTWVNHVGDKLAGKYTISVPTRLTNSADDLIIPAGVFAQGELVTSPGVPSMSVLCPATDDPDIQQDGWKLTVEVSFTGGQTAERYDITVPIADRPIVDGGTGVGVNLRTIVFPTQMPTQAAMYGVDRPLGLVTLDEAGLVPAERLPGGIGGGVSSWDDLDDKPAVIAAGSTAAEARTVIGAVAADDARLSDARTPLDGSVTNSKVASGISAEKLIDGATRKLLTVNERAKLASVVNALDFGAVGDGVADDTAALNAAAASINANSNARLVIPAGTYRTTEMVTLGCSVSASEATIRYSGTGTALMVGTDVFAGVVSRKRFDLPRVVCASRPATLWDGSSRGVTLSNLNDCVVDVPFIQDFEEGLLVYGKGQGTAYCQIHLGSLWNNHRQLILDCDATGWANQNVFIGGRLQQVLERGATADDVNASQILIGRGGSQPGQNTFIGTSFEGANPSYYKLDCAGRWNMFINCRWEKFTGACRVRWGSNAYANVIERGYDSHLIEEIYVAGSSNNEVRTRYGSYIEASNIVGQSIPNGGGSTPFMTITGWTSTHRGAGFNGDGTWTPRQGRWRISANVSVKDTTGSVLVQALAGGSRIIDAASGPVAASGATMYKLGGSAYFSGTESLILRIRQDATLDRQLTTTAGYTELRAEYVGPA